MLECILLRTNSWESGNQSTSNTPGTVRRLTRKKKTKKGEADLFFRDGAAVVWQSV